MNGPAEMAWSGLTEWPRLYREQRWAKLIPLKHSGVGLTSLNFTVQMVYLNKCRSRPSPPQLASHTTQPPSQPSATKNAHHFLSPRDTCHAFDFTLGTHIDTSIAYACSVLLLPPPLLLLTSSARTTSSNVTSFHAYDDMTHARLTAALCPDATRHSLVPAPVTHCFRTWLYVNCASDACSLVQVGYKAA